MALVLVAAIYFLLWLIRSVWRSPKVFAKWRGQKNHDQAEKQFGSGYLSMIKGDWKKAESLLLKKTKHSGIPYANFLAAAQAAQEQGKIESRDEYIKAAYDAAPRERLAIGLIKAKLHQQAGQLDQSLATLKDLEIEGKQNSQYVAMMLQTHEQMQDWNAAEALLPTAKKLKALPEIALDEIQAQVYGHALLDSDDMTSAWQKLPKIQKKQPSNVSIYAGKLVERDEVVAAEKLISTALKNTWDDKLVALYGSLPTDKPGKLVRKVQGWLMARPESAELNLAAGRLAFADGDHDSAKQYLQEAIRLGQLPQAYGVLGEVFEASNDSGQALQFYRAGMQSLSAGAIETDVDRMIDLNETEQDEDVQTAKEGELV